MKASQRSIDSLFFKGNFMNNEIMSSKRKGKKG